MKNLNKEIGEIIKLGMIALALFMVGLLVVGTFNGGMAVVFLGYGLIPMGKLRSIIGVRLFVLPTWTGLFVALIALALWLCVAMYAGFAMFAFYWVRAIYRLVVAIVARKKESQFSGNVYDNTSLI